jgi:hypothetical protein
MGRLGNDCIYVIVMCISLGKFILVGQKIKKNVISLKKNHQTNFLCESTF